MNPADLQSFFSNPPASFVWSASTDGLRTLGTSPGAIMDIQGDQAQLACLFPPDDAARVQRSTALMLLLLAAQRPLWQTAEAWLTSQMRLAARSKEERYEGPNYAQRVVFIFEKRISQAIVRVMR